MIYFLKFLMLCHWLYPKRKLTLNDEMFLEPIQNNKKISYKNVTKLKSESKCDN
jgi:hypothetical protein